MITAIANAPDGKRIILLGHAREHRPSRRGKPMRPSAETTWGSPPTRDRDHSGEDEHALTEVEAALSGETKIVSVLREKAQ